MVAVQPLLVVRAAVAIMEAVRAVLETHQAQAHPKEMLVGQEPESHLITALEVVAQGRLVKEAPLAVAEMGAMERHLLSRVRRLPEPVAVEAAVVATLVQEALEEAAMVQQDRVHRGPETPEVAAAAVEMEQAMVVQA